MPFVFLDYKKHPRFNSKFCIIKIDATAKTDHTSFLGNSKDIYTTHLLVLEDNPSYCN